MFRNVYRVKVDGTGEIFESETNVKWLYHQALWSMRGSLYGHRKPELLYSIVQYGILLEKEDCTVFVPTRDVCSISVLSLNGTMKNYITKY